MVDLEKALMGQKKIIQNKEVLKRGYSPSTLKEVKHRDEESLEIGNVMKDALYGEVPNNIILHGGSGSGKTMLASLVLDDLQAISSKHGHGLIYIYINCENLKTEMRVITRIISVLEMELHAARPPLINDTNAYFKWFAKLVDSTPLPIILIFDEVDLLNDPNILNAYTRLIENGDAKRNVCVFGITNNIDFLKSKLNARTLSGLGIVEEVILNQYNAVQLADILSDRARLGLFPNTYDECAVPLCAAFAAQENGDARYAIDMLRKAAEITEKLGEELITEQIVQRAREEVELDKIKVIVTSLPEQQKLVILATYYLTSGAGNPVVSANEVYAMYKQLAVYADMYVVSKRRTTDVISELDSRGILNATVISKGRYGRIKEIRLAQTPEVIREILLDDYKLRMFRDYKPARATQLHL